MVSIYDYELSTVLDRLIPAREIIRRPRHSDPWIDSECSSSKRLTRLLERRYESVRRRAVPVCQVDASEAAWYDQRRAYRRLRQRKCTEFWSERIEADCADPRKIWSSVNVLRGRGNSPHSSAISAEDFCRSFADKVAKIRATTADADAPTFFYVRTGISLQSSFTLGLSR